MPNSAVNPIEVSVVIARADEGEVTVVKVFAPMKYCPGDEESRRAYVKMLKERPSASWISRS